MGTEVALLFYMLLDTYYVPNLKSDSVFSGCLTGEMEQGDK